MWTLLTAVPLDPSGDMNNTILPLALSAAFAVATSLPATAASDNPIWGTPANQSLVQLTVTGKHGKGSLYCSGTIVSDRHVVTASHCFEVGQALEVTSDDVAVGWACTAPGDANCHKAIRSDLYRDGDLAVMTFAEGTFADKTPVKFGIQTPSAPLGMKFKICGRNHSIRDESGTTAKEIRRNSMGCTGELDSYSYSMRQNHTWPGEMARHAVTEHWGPFASYQLLKRWKGTDWAVHVHAKTDYVSEVAGGDSGGGWFATTDGSDEERLVAVSSFHGPVSWTKISHFFGVAGVILEGKTLDWLHTKVYGPGAQVPAPPAITYYPDTIVDRVDGFAKLITEYEDQMKRANPELFDATDLSPHQGHTQDGTGQREAPNSPSPQADDQVKPEPPVEGKPPKAPPANPPAQKPPANQDQPQSPPEVPGQAHQPEPDPQPRQPDGGGHAPAPQPPVGSQPPVGVQPPVAPIPAPALPTPNHPPTNPDIPKVPQENPTRDPAAPTNPNPDKPGSGHPNLPPAQVVADKPMPPFVQLGKEYANTPFNQRFTTPVPEVAVSRIAGDTRIDTAVQMFTAAANKKVAVLATGRTYADGLAGGSLAGALKTGMLLTNATDTDPLEPQILDTLKASGTTDVYITGGNNAIGKGVEASLFNAGITVKRLAGFNRFETADLVAEAVTELVAQPGPVFVASGANFPDALVASSAAARVGGTVRLVDAFHTYEGNGYCIGGPACAHAPNTVRVIGQDRYETAYQLAARLPFSGKIIAVSGKNFPDALAAGALSATTGATMVLTDGNQVGVPEGTKTVTMVGGTNVIKEHAPVKR